MKFSSRGRHICRESDPSQPMHFLSRQYDRQVSKCIICKFKTHRSNSRYYLHCDTCDYDIHKNCYFLPICRASDLSKPHTIRLQHYGFFDYHADPTQRIGHSKTLDRLCCYTCGGDIDDDVPRYFCQTCNLYFHRVCHLYPPHITHPFHSHHPLKLTFSEDSSLKDLLPSHSHLPLTEKLKNLPATWQEEPSDSETEPDASDDASISDVKCKCCQRQLQKVYYHCVICNFSLNLTCTRNPPPCTIFNPKSHDHTLFIFPRRISSLCDACGLSLENTHDLVYACLPCNFMVHKSCTFLPRVIKITRHPHRLSLSPSLPSALFPCGVCRLTINVTYGQFSCQKGCHYAVHSKCAVEERVWDGKDLEGVPEVPIEDVDPFVRIDDETIQHFSHEHYLKLQMDNVVWDGNILCQACSLPILLSKSFYSCVTFCDFILHEECASLPRKKDHPLHRHPLNLHLVPPKPFEVVMLMRNSTVMYEKRSDYIQNMFKCNGCGQTGYGFVYRCNENGCKFQLDARCASLPDPFIHGSHPHGLFFNLNKGECMGCKSDHCSPYFLECMESKSFLGLKCATLPSEAYYKHDKHPLTLCYGEEDATNGQYWCEICEAKLDEKEWFYTCNDYCNVTVHVRCLLGVPIFLKPTSFEVNRDGNGYTVSIIRNNGNTRPICYRCGRRSAEPFLLKFKDFYSCSFKCLWGGTRRIGIL